MACEGQKTSSHNLVTLTCAAPSPEPALEWSQGHTWNLQLYVARRACGVHLRLPRHVHVQHFICSVQQGDGVTGETEEPLFEDTGPG